MELREMIEQFMINYGVISIFIIVALEYANVPLPSEIVLPLAGIFAYEYHMGFFNVVLVSVLGGVVGSLLNYYLGHRFGRGLIDAISDKFPRSRPSIDSSYKWIKKYDKLSVLLTRVVPLARTFVSIVAGVIKMNIITFMIYSAIGIGIWNFALIGIGYMVGDNLKVITSILTKYSYLVGIVVVAIVIVYVIRKLVIKNKKIYK